MSISDETLMAFADGELDEVTRRVVEQAVRMDPALADKVRRHKEVPQRLQAAARSAKVVHLDSVRQLRTPPPAPPVPDRPRWSWPEWGALVATLVVGVLAGVVGTQGLRSEQPLAYFDTGAGALTARGALAQALSQQLASGAALDPNVKVGISFLSKEGAYCRSFMLPTTAGLACRSGDQWRIPVLTNGAMGTAGEYRQAGTALPAAVLEAIDARIAGQALDQQAERAAQKQGWKR